ncbi:MAG: glycosyltransferase [Patescibacteria group bacterium]
MNSQKIKIMYVLTGLHTGGAEVLLRDLLRKIDREKFEPVVVSIVPIGQIGKEIEQAGDRVISLKINRKWNFLLMFGRFLKLIKKEKPQIIHAHLFHAIFLSRLAKLFNKKTKIISTIHNENIGGRSREFLLRMTDRLSDITNTISQRVSEIMVDKKVVKKDKVRTVYNGIDLEKFYPDPEKGKKIKERLDIENNYPVLISVGRLAEAKGFGYLLESVKELKKEYNDIVLIILGEGEKRQELESKIKDLNLENNIFLSGNKSNVVDYLNSADIFVSSSLWEGLPTAILEAMACGLPVVATNVGGTAEIVEDGRQGLLMDSQSPEQITEKVTYLLNNDEKKDKFRKEARIKIKNNFTLEEMVKNYEKMYIDLCEKREK